MFSVSNLHVGLTVAFSDDCVELLLGNRMDENDLERGGLLFATPIINDYVVVTKATLPTNKDKSGKYFFKPDPVLAQAEICRQFERNLAYVGDWHTHPTILPKPSIKDVTTIKSVYRKSEHCLNYVLMVIVGASDNINDSYFCLSNGNEIFELN